MTSADTDEPKLVDPPPADAPAPMATSPIRTNEPEHVVRTERVAAAFRTNEPKPASTAYVDRMNEPERPSNASGVNRTTSTDGGPTPTATILSSPGPSGGSTAARQPTDDPVRTANRTNEPKPANGSYYTNEPEGRPTPPC